MSSVTPENGEQVSEPHAMAGAAARLNWLRAAVLGANDGIVSVAAVVVGVAGAGAATAILVATGLAALVGGALSMALGEYVSVSSQRDSQRAMIELERQELEDDPDAELAELAGMYRAQGLTESTARRVAEELTAHDALKAHLAIELRLHEDDVVSAWHAAAASAASFLVGGLLPFLTIVLVTGPLRVPVTFVAVVAALGATGAFGARIGGSPIALATSRVIIGGALALAATFALGRLIGASGLI